MSATVEKLKTWQKEEIDKSLQDGGWERSPHYEEEKARRYQNIEEYAAFVQSAIDNKQDSDVIRLYEYFENAVHNRFTVNLFSAITGIHAGATNKSAMKAFVAYFGNHIPDTIRKERKQKIDQEKEAARQAKEAEQKKILSFFENPIFDMEKVKALTPAQRGRVKKSLEKLFRFDGVVESLKDNLISINPLHKYATDNMSKWNRRKFNNMYADEQREYEQKLLNGRTYLVQLDEVYSREIPKIVFNILALEDKTNKELGSW